MTDHAASPNYTIEEPFDGIQLEGVTADGRRFYFHDRGGQWYIMLGPVGGDLAAVFDQGSTIATGESEEDNGWGQTTVSEVDRILAAHIPGVVIA